MKLNKDRLLQNKNFLVLIIFVVLSVVFLSPFLKISGGYIVNGDWSQFNFYEESFRKTVLDYKQIPLWNPYQCGGNILLANGQTSVLSPISLITIIFGVPTGLKIKAIIMLLIGLIGTYMLSGYYQLKKSYRLVPSFIFMFSSPFVLYLGAGQLWMLNMSFIPWVIFFYKKSFNNFNYSLLSGLVLGFIWINGGLHIFPFTILFLGICAFIDFLDQRNILIIKLFVIIIIVGFLTPAIKLLPSADTFINNNRIIEETDGFNIKLFLDSLIRTNITTTKFGIHEYGQYVGLLSIILFIIGLFILWGKNWKLLLLSIILLLITLGSESPIKILNIIRLLPVFSSMHISARFRILFLLCFSLISALALDKIVRIKTINNIDHKLKKLFVYLIIIFIITNLILTNQIYLNNLSVEKKDFSDFSKDFTQTINLNLENQTRKQFDNIFKNKGSIQCYEVFLIPTASKQGIWYYHTGSAIPISDESYQGEAFLHSKNEEVKYSFWSPNKLIFNQEIKPAEVLIINQNYHDGWKAYNKKHKIAVENYNGLISAKIDTRINNITFYYLPKEFLIGSIISFISVGWIIIKIRNKKFY